MWNNSPNARDGESRGAGPAVQALILAIRGGARKPLWKGRSFHVVCLTTALMALRVDAAPPRVIRIDGDFADWAAVPAYADPTDDQHDTDHDGPLDTPAHVDHPDVDILEYRFAHDGRNLYAYFKARGVIGRTQVAGGGQRAGRYYAIVTIDVDNDDATGYWLHEGGYYPTSNGYDMNMEIEWYDGAFNTGHYINHGARNAAELDAAVQDQRNGIVRVLPGTYDYYTQWVWFDDLSGEVPLGDGSGNSITFVTDRGPVVRGVIDVALSPGGHEMEMVAPFRGFMKDPGGRPIVALGRTIDVSFSLEASGELAPGRAWASDTAAPTVGYILAPSPGDFDLDDDVDLNDFAGFQACFNGPNRPPAGPECDAANLDGDTAGDVDLSDFGILQSCFNGPNRPPACL